MRLPHGVVFGGITTNDLTTGGNATTAMGRRSRALRQLGSPPPPGGVVTSQVVVTVRNSLGVESSVAAVAPLVVALPPALDVTVAGAGNTAAVVGAATSAMINAVEQANQDFKEGLLESSLATVASAAATVNSVNGDVLDMAGGADSPLSPAAFPYGATGSAFGTTAPPGSSTPPTNAPPGASSPPDSLLMPPPPPSSPPPEGGLLPQGSSAAAVLAARQDAREQMALLVLAYLKLTSMTASSRELAAGVLAKASGAPAEISLSAFRTILGAIALLLRSGRAGPPSTPFDVAPPVMTMGAARDIGQAR